MKTLVSNVARFPAATLAIFVASPVTLREESTETLTKIARIWTREGLRAKVIDLAASDSIPMSARYALLKGAGQHGSTTH